MAYTYCANVVLDEADSGAALTFAFVDADFAPAAGASAAYQELAGTGQYRVTLTLPDGFRGFCDVSAAGVPVVTFALNPQDAENADVKVSTRPAASDYTPARAAKLDNLDAAVSSRESEAAAAARHTEVIDDYLNDGLFGLPAIETLLDEMASLIGQNSEAATDPSLGTGTIFSKLRGLGADTDAISVVLGNLTILVAPTVIEVNNVSSPLEISSQTNTVEVDIISSPIEATEAVTTTEVDAETNPVEVKECS